MFDNQNDKNYEANMNENEQQPPVNKTAGTPYEAENAVQSENIPVKETEAVNYNQDINQEVLKTDTEEYNAVSYTQPNDPVPKESHEPVLREDTQNQNETYYSYNWDGKQEVQNYYNSYGYAQNTQPDDGYYRYSGDQLNNSTNVYNSGYTNGYSAQQPTQAYANTVSNQQVYTQPKKQKKTKKPIGRGALALVLVCCILFSGAVGVGGGYLAFTTLSNSESKAQSDDMNLNKDTSGAITTGSNDGDTTSLSTTEIAAIAADSVVEITTEVVTTGGFSQQYINSGAGSGVIFTENGYIVTNNHVIENASKVTVTLRDGTSYDAKLVGTDSTLDIALLKIEATGLKAATLGDSDELQVGEKTVAIGNPLGQLGGTVTDGILSALSREVVIDNVTMTLLQTNAAINPGNSGGGLFDGQGRLIGIVNAKSSGSEIEGLGFAIPINNVTDILEDLKEHGYVRGRVHMGVSLLDITSTQMAMMYGVSETGCYVQKVESGSSAESAGFQLGDRIKSINGKEITSSAELKAQLNTMKVGDEVTFVVVRNNKQGELKLTLEEEIPDSVLSNNGSGDFGSNESTTETNSGNDSGGSSIWDYFNW